MWKPEGGGNPKPHLEDRARQSSKWEKLETTWWDLSSGNSNAIDNFRMLMFDVPVNPQESFDINVNLDWRVEFRSKVPYPNHDNPWQYVWLMKFSDAHKQSPESGSNGSWHGQESLVKFAGIVAEGKRVFVSAGHPKTGCMTNTLELLRRHRKTIYLKKFSFSNSIWHRGLSPVWLLVRVLAFGGSGSFQDGLRLNLSAFTIFHAFPSHLLLGILRAYHRFVLNIFKTYFVILVSFNPFSTTLVIRTVRFGSWHPSYVRATSQTGGAVMLPSWRQENYRHIQACGIRMVSSGISPKFWLMLVDVGWYSKMFVSYDYGHLWLYNILGGWLW
jgi:hypothetical protein